MTTGDVLAALRRRWYVVLLGLLVTGVVAVLAHGTTGVYQGHRNVRLVAPPGTYNNVLAHSSVNLTALAGLVERTVNQHDALPPTASVDITLADRGIRRGSAITLPNSGGQWSYQFDSPELLVQASGASPEEVVRLEDEATKRIDVALADIQAEVVDSSRVEARVARPASAVGYERGRPHPALAAIVLLGLGLSGSAAVLVERVVPVLAPRLRSRRRLRFQRRAPA